LLRNRRGGYHYRPEVWSHCCRAFDTAPPVPSSGNANTALDRIEIPRTWLSGSQNCCRPVHHSPYPITV
jgi:hypothetical protein